MNAGLDQTIPFGGNATLNATVTYTSAAPLTVAWKWYTGPANVTFTTTNQTNSVVSFTAPGNYTFMFSAANGVHTPAYDAVIVNVMPTLRIHFTRSGTNVALKWSGGSPPYHLEHATSLTLSDWSSVLTTNGTNVTLPMSGSAAFYRVLGN